MDTFWSQKGQLAVYEVGTECNEREIWTQTKKNFESSYSRVGVLYGAGLGKETIVGKGYTSEDRAVPCGTSRYENENKF